MEGPWKEQVPTTSILQLLETSQSTTLAKVESKWNQSGKQLADEEEWE